MWSLWKLTTLCFLRFFFVSSFFFLLFIFRRPDFAITTTKTLVLEYPLFIVQPSATNRSPYKHDLDAPTRFGVLPRHPHQGERPTWFEASSCFAYHSANAFESEDGRYITIVACVSPHMNLGGLASTMYRFKRFTIDLERKDGQVDQEEDLAVGMDAEFPTVDPRLVGRRCRYVYAAKFAEAPGEQTTASFDGVVKLDLETGDTTTHTFVGGGLGGEVAFAPYGKEEEDGVLLTFVFDPATNTSSVYVIDARTMNCVATVGLPERVPFGFHSTWAAAEVAKVV